MPPNRPPHCILAPSAPLRIELLGDGLRDELGVELRARDLPHVDLHPLAGEALQLAPQGVHLAAALADHDARTGGVDVHRDLALLGGLADLEVLAQQLRVVPVRVPVALMGYPLALALDPEPEALRVYFLTHLFLLALGRVCS